MKHSFFLLFFLLLTPALFAQKNKSRKTEPTPAQTFQPVDTSLFRAVSWRNIGPFRGGRSAAVTGVAGRPNLFYFGSTGGGVWRTQDGGRSWDNISDGFFGGSIGAIEVAASDHNVIYVGGGEKTVRGNVSSGSGMWKSEDAGKTWKAAGLKNSRHIPRIRVHPTNPDMVYAAVLGDLYQDSDERGVYRSTNGGKTWERILFVNASSGAIDLSMDPTNPRILYASLWRVRRTPWSLSSGGEGSGLWKSTDGGNTWTDLSRNEGMPKDTMGIIGVTVSAARPERVWALVESQTGGLFRSDNGGKSWAKINEDRNLRQRAWYYTRLYADPNDADLLYVMNVAYHRSKDGGKSFTSQYAPHGDHHDLWIAPDDPNRMIIGDDGGAQVTYDGGETWSTYHNQPTAQFYRVTTDNAFPYRIYAAQQDNSTVRIAHRTDGYNIGERDWESTAGGESGHIAVDPLNDDVVYGGSYHGYLTRVDHKNKSERLVNVWPEDNMGHGAEDAKYRFQWNFPIFFSPNNSKKLYAASNHLHLSTDEGQTWTTISPDLTTNDRSKQKSSGGPITQDNTSVEYYCTLFAAAESRLQEGLIWTGSDDGLVHLTRDGGTNWSNVTPADLPKWTMINCIEPDVFNAGGCYIAGTAYKNGDYRPYLYRTSDYGATWQKITRGINEEHFTRVIRADPERRGLLYAGTEAGMYVSFDDGANWQPFQLNLPVVPITDLTLKAGNLIAATQGRSLWIIDDLSVLHQLDRKDSEKEMHLYKPDAAYRMGGGGNGKASKTAGGNRQNGVFVHYYLKNKPGEKDTISIDILEPSGKVIKTFSTHDKDNKIKPEQGNNLFVWNMRYPDAIKFDGMILWSYNLAGPKAVPGTYKVRLRAKGQTLEQDMQILADPRSKTTSGEYRAQFDFVQQVSDTISAMHRCIREIRDVRAQINDLKNKLPKEDKYKPLTTRIAQMDSVMTSVENNLYQTKNRSSQDPLNYPVKLNDKLANLMGLNVDGDYPPTEASRKVFDILSKQAGDELARWQTVKITDLPELNKMVREMGVDVVRLNPDF
ncbi:MAG: glycosyl hydrolase [Saprospiraceae bacterium]|nr:glycosyl hydrolase [Saprospiraceae bacterium]MCC6414257.1 glycosyl hydrolase [Saprospiraceae bacterium]